MARKHLESASGTRTEITNGAMAVGAGAGAGALIGAGIGSLGGPIGAAVGAAIGAAVGLIAGIATSNASSKAETDALEALEKAYLEDETVLQKLKNGSLTEQEWTEMGIDDAALRESLERNADEVADLVEEMGANTTALRAQNDAIAAQTLSTHEGVQNSEFQDQIIDVVGDAYGVLYDKAMSSSWADSWGKDGIAKINKANAEAKKVFKEYLEYAGLEDAGYTLVDTTGTDKNRKFVYKDAEGNKQTISLEAMQAARAAYEANSELSKIADKLLAGYSRLEYSGDKKD